MTDLAAAPRPSSGLAALLRHGRYVIAENRITGFAFGLGVERFGHLLAPAERSAR